MYGRSSITATPQAAGSPCTGEPRGSCGGSSVFFEYWMPFHGERQPLRPQRRPAPLTQGSQGLLRGEQRIFRISGFLSRKNGNPSGRSGGQLPLHRGARGVSCGGTAYFSNIGCPFAGERQPFRPQRRPAPLTQGSQGSLLRGYSVFFEYRASFHGRTATPQAAAAASSPYAGEPRGSCGGTVYFSNIGCPFTGNGNPSGRSGGQLPLHRGARGSCGGSSVFFEYRASFHGRTATPQAAAAASSPCTGEPGGIHAGDPVQKKGFRR